MQDFITRLHEVPAVRTTIDKAVALLDYCRENRVDPREVAFVGNDVNDIPALHAVGLPIAVRDAHAEVFPHVAYRTATPGGRGAVREICDLIFHAKSPVGAPGSR